MKACSQDWWEWVLKNSEDALEFVADLKGTMDFGIETDLVQEFAWVQLLVLLPDLQQH